MKTKIILSLLLFSASITGFCTKWTISNSGFTFSPDTIIITLGDSVDFSIASTHNAVEVSQATWDAKGNTALGGGFSVPFGGGLVLPDKLTVGTHWYVCTPHASAGMIGVIIVNNITDTEKWQPEMDISVFPNPADDFITVKANEDYVGSRYFITDLTGAQILSGTVDYESVSIDIRNLKPGLYLLQVGDQRRKTFKVMKN